VRRGRGVARKTGVVISLRVNSEDCLRVMDFADKCGFAGLTFPQKVSRTLSGLLEVMEKQGVIPEPDMFQYGNRMQDVIAESSPGGAVARSVNGRLNFAAPQPAAEPSPVPATPAGELDPEFEKRIDRFWALEFKRENADPSFSDEEKLEYRELFRFLYPKKAVPAI
jgi:hypothetical protein